MSVLVPPSLPLNEIAALCRRWQVRELSLFGSAARGADFTPDSDIDLLVSFEPDNTYSLFDFAELRDELQDSLAARLT